MNITGINYQTGVYKSSSVNQPKEKTKGNVLYFTANMKPLNLYKRYNLDGKNILITGGTGTVGSHILEDLLGNYKPKNIIIYSRDEAKQHQLRNKYKSYANIKYVIGDVRDKESLGKSFRDVDVVIHTAAMKHVPICEENPAEAIKTNIDGVRNIIDSVLDNGVERVLAISSDKAVNPTTLYGATKFAGEKLMTDANKYTGADDARFCCIRLGNVLGSRGSIIPLFKEQAKKGELTVTDEKMTRFFMTPEQAVNLTLSSIESMNGGEVFIPKLKNTNVMKMAQKIAPEARIKIIGARPGEKLSEEFISSVENPNTIEIYDKYIILPNNQINDYQTLWKGSKRVSPDFDYSSANPDYQMSDKELGNIINQFV